MEQILKENEPIRSDTSLTFTKVKFFLFLFNFCGGKVVEVANGRVIILATDWSEIDGISSPVRGSRVESSRAASL